MKTKTSLALVGAILITLPATAATVLYDFENATPGASVPLSLTVDGVTASFTSQGAGGYFIANPQSIIFQYPAGFSGQALVPSGSSLTDLLVSFSDPLDSFSILYSPDMPSDVGSSATMSVTAYLGTTLVGTSTSLSGQGVYPSGTLAFSSASPFDNVVVHYASLPPTSEGFNQIFMADNMQIRTVTTSVPETLSTGLALLVVMVGAAAGRAWRRK